MERDVPVGGRDFQVWFGVLGPRGGRAKTFEVACSEVVLPRLGPGRDDGASTRLVLRRGHTGSNELYRWWRAQHDGERRRVQEVAVDVLDERREPVTRWEFTGCRLIALEYTPLDAVRSAVLVESIEIEFDEVVQRAMTR